nr:class I SAM-dependent methyltransferase [Neisseria sp. HSC-16F19]
MEIGCGNGGFTRLLADVCPNAHWTLNDLCDTRACFDFLPQARFVCGDAEQADLGCNHDLLAAASAVQWFARPQDWPERAAAALAHGGLLLFNTFDPDNLAEVRHCSGRGLHYPGIDDWRQWLAPHFHIHHIGSEAVRLELADPMAVLHHLKRTGVTATSHGQVWSKGRLAEFCRRYRALYSTPEGKVTLTYTPLYVLAEKKR